MAFFDTAGRIGIIRFLVAGLVTIAILLGCIDAMMRLPTMAYPLLGAIAGLALCGLGCEAARRLHDLGLTAWLLVIAAPLLGGITLAIEFLLLAGTAAWVIGGSAAAAAALLFLRPGDRAANRFGSPPTWILGRGIGAHPASRLGAIAALGCAIAVGASIGYLIHAYSEGMRAQVERSARMTMTVRNPLPMSGGERRA